MQGKCLREVLGRAFFRQGDVDVQLPLSIILFGAFACLASKELSDLLSLQPRDSTYSLHHCSSFLGLPYRVLNIYLVRFTLTKNRKYNGDFR